MAPRKKIPKADAPPPMKRPGTTSKASPSTVPPPVDFSPEESYAAVEGLIHESGFENIPYLTKDLTNGNGPWRIGTNLRATVKAALSEEGLTQLRRNTGTRIPIATLDSLRHLRRLIIHGGAGFTSALAPSREPTRDVGIVDSLRDPDIDDDQPIVSLSAAVKSNLEDLRKGYRDVTSWLSPDKRPGQEYDILAAHTAKGMIEEHLRHLLLAVGQGLGERRMQRKELGKLHGVQEGVSHLGHAETGSTRGALTAIIDSPVAGTARLLQLVEEAKQIRTSMWITRESMEQVELVKRLEELLSKGEFSIGEEPQRDLLDRLGKGRDFAIQQVALHQSLLQIKDSLLERHLTSEDLSTLNLLTDASHSKLSALADELGDEGLKRLAQAIEETEEGSLAPETLDQLARLARRGHNTRTGARPRALSLGDRPETTEILLEGVFLDKYTGMPVSTPSYSKKATLAAFGKGSKESEKPTTVRSNDRKGQGTESTYTPSRTTPDPHALEPPTISWFSLRKKDERKKAQEQKQLETEMSAKESFAAHINDLLSRLKEPDTVPDVIDPPFKTDFGSVMAAAEQESPGQSSGTRTTDEDSLPRLSKAELRATRQPGASVAKWLNRWVVAAETEALKRFGKENSKKSRAATRKLIRDMDDTASYHRREGMDPEYPGTLLRTASI